MKSTWSSLEVAELGRLGLLDLEHEVAPPGGGGVADPRPDPLVRGVGEVRALARAVLHPDLVAVAHELVRARRGQRHPVLVRLDLGRHADAHPLTPSRRRGTEGSSPTPPLARQADRRRRRGGDPASAPSASRKPWRRRSPTRSKSAPAARGRAGLARGERVVGERALGGGEPRWAAARSRSQNAAIPPAEELRRAAGRRLDAPGSQQLAHLRRPLGDAAVRPCG